MMSMDRYAALSAVFVIALMGSSVQGRREVKEFIIDLDAAPEDRFLGLFTGTDFNATVWEFYNDYFAHDAVLRDALYGIVDARGDEVDELQREINGLAKTSGLPVKFVSAVQMLYELQTIMVPVENITLPSLIPTGYEALARIPWRGPGCTGIIAKCADGTVYHARNLDFSPVKIMTNLVYTGIFHKGGKEIFRSQMVAGYQCAVTGMKKGINGFTIERNTRYPEGKKGNEEMLRNLLVEKRPLNGWTLRKVLENSPDYDAAISAISAAPYVSTEYAIISGVQKGVIYSKSPDAVDYVQTLGQANYEEPDNYIIITNFDFFFHDIREYFDPTGGEIGYPRRIAAQKILNGTTSLTPEILFDTINHKGVIADTIFQGVFNVQQGLWNVSQPDL